MHSVTRQRSHLAALLRLTELADLIVPLAVRTAAELRIADVLGDGPQFVADIAVATGTHPQALARLLKTLASHGLFRETTTGCFALTPAGELLRQDHPLSLRDAFPLLPSDMRAWGNATSALRTGQPSFDTANGQSYWDYLRDHPETSERVDRSVESSNRIVVRMFARSYDWDEIGVLVDIAGGNGSFLAGLLARYPHLHGVLFDQAHVLADSPRVLAAAGVVNRCTAVAGSFFDPIPVTGDAYLLKTILHDWTDGPAAAMLARVRAAMPAHARLLVIEALLQPGNAYDIGKLLDLQSFMLAGGVDRSEAQLVALLHASGFRVRRVLKTTNALVLIESVIDLDA